MQYKHLRIIISFLLLISGCSSNNSVWRPLFNGKDLTGWDTYLGPKYDTILKKFDTIPTGLNIDPSKVFSVVKLGDENVIRISGENFGGISTISEYDNYHLQLQFRWGQLKWPPRKKEKRDSGLMYHAVGPNGADDGNWMRSHEFQIEEGDCGDYWACAGAVFDIMARKDNDSTYVYDNNGHMLTFSTSSSIGRNCIKFPDAEKPTGEWNTLDLYCYGNTSVHMVNGVVNMILNNSRQSEAGKEIPLTRGKIQIQSEGSEIYYRDIKICSIDKIPARILNEKTMAR
jgi:hypothetical protein